MNFKKTFLLLNYCIIYTAVHSQNQWAIIGGDINSPTPVYGTQGVPSVLNKPQAIYEGARWTDKNGNLWLYGDNVNDMWKYNPYTQEWTWVAGTHATNVIPVYGTKGVMAASNTPGGRHFCPSTWTDNNGDLWLLGGETTFDFAKRSDLWRYNIAANMWTWMAGPNTAGDPGTFGTKGVPAVANTPPCRTETACQWVDDNNNLWLFGGLGASQLDLNDLWMYNQTTAMWTWVSGSSVGNQAGIYGNKGVASPTNVPGGRAVYTPWKDVNGNFYLFGGFSNIAYSNFNDVWKYDIAANMWTWMNGISGPNQQSNFGNNCSPDTVHYPWARHENRAMWSYGNHFIMYGGYDLQHGFFHDVWSYNADCNEWTWMSGTQNSNMPAVYGTFGVPSPINTPNGDFGNFSFQDTLGNCFLFGGWNSGNQLWQLFPDTACWASSPCSPQGAGPVVNFSATDSIWCEKDCIDFADLSTNTPTSWSWTFGGAMPDTSTMQNPQGICFNNYGTYNIQLIACNAFDCDTLTINNFITVLQSPPIPTVTYLNDTLFASPAYAYQWYAIPLPIPGATLPYYVPTAPGSYYVLVYDSNGCATASPAFVVTSLQDSENPIPSIHPNPAYDELFITMPYHCENVTITLYDNIGKLIPPTYYHSSSINEEQLYVKINNLPSGNYIIRIQNDNTIMHGKFAKHK